MRFVATAGRFEMLAYAKSNSRTSPMRPDAQKFLQSAPQLRQRSNLAFPYDHRAPAEPVEASYGASVPRAIVCYLVGPELATGRRNCSLLAALMTVPKAAMYKNCLAPRGEDKIGRSGKISAVKPKPVAHLVHQASYCQFRLGIPALDSCHQGAPPRRGKRVDHNRVPASARTNPYNLQRLP